MAVNKKNLETVQGEVSNNYNLLMCSTLGSVVPHGASSIIGSDFFVNFQERLIKVNSAGGVGVLILITSLL